MHATHNCSVQRPMRIAGSRPTAVWQPAVLARLHAARTQAQTDTIGTPSDGGSSWSLREPCGEEDGEVSAAARGKVAVWQPHQHRRGTFGQWRPERVVGAQLSDRDAVGRRLYIGARMTDNTAPLGQSADSVWQLSR
jgi:hypothetical protein